MLKSYKVKFGFQVVLDSQIQVHIHKSLAYMLTIAIYLKIIVSV